MNNTLTLKNVSIPLLGRKVGLPLLNLIQNIKPQVPQHNPVTGCWYYKDSIGVRDGDVQSNCYELDGIDDEIDFGVGLANETLTYTYSGVEQTVTLNASGVLTGFSGKLGNLYLKDGGGNYLHMWHCDENGGTTTWDSVGTAHGTITNITPSTFFATGELGFRSYQNELGYSEGTGLYAGSLIPIALDNQGQPTSVDVLGNTPTYTGRARYNDDITQSWVGSFDGLATYLELTGADLANATSISARIKTTGDWFIDDGSEPGLWSGAGTTITIGKNGLTFLEGEIDYVILTSPNKTYLYDFSTGGGLTVYDREKEVLGDNVADGWNFLNWTTTGTTINVTENSFTSVSAAGRYSPVGTPMLTAGLTYKLKIKGNISSGIMQVYQGASSGTRVAVGNANGGDFEQTIIFTAIDSTEKVILFRNSTSAVLTIESFENLIIYPAISGTITDATGFWQPDDCAEPSNLINGFDLWQKSGEDDIRVPFNTDGESILTDGDAPPETGYTWTYRCVAGKWHNRAESTTRSPEANDLWEADQDMKFLFGTDLNDGDSLVVGVEYIIKSQSTLDFTTVGATDNKVGTRFTSTVTSALGFGDKVTIDDNSQTPRDITHDEMPYDVYELDPKHKIFYNAKPYEKKNKAVYSVEQVEPELSKIYKYQEDPISRDENGDPNLDENGDIIYLT